jgi:hypothetical protein
MASPLAGYTVLQRMKLKDASWFLANVGPLLRMRTLKADDEAGDMQPNGVFIGYAVAL